MGQWDEPAGWQTGAVAHVVMAGETEPWSWTVRFGDGDAQEFDQTHLEIAMATALAVTQRLAGARICVMDKQNYRAATPQHSTRTPDLSRTHHIYSDRNSARCLK